MRYCCCWSCWRCCDSCWWRWRQNSDEMRRFSLSLIVFIIHLYTKTSREADKFFSSFSFTQIISLTLFQYILFRVLWSCCGKPCSSCSCIFISYKSFSSFSFPIYITRACVLVSVVVSAVPGWSRGKKNNNLHICLLFSTISTDLTTAHRHHHKK